MAQAQETVTSSSSTQDVDVEILWALLKKNLIDLFENNQLDRAITCELYNSVHQFCINCIQKKSSSLSVEDYQRYIFCRGGIEILYRKIDNFLQSYASDLLKVGIDCVNKDVLNFYARNWSKYQSSCVSLTSILSSVNEFWVVPQREDGRSMQYIYDLAMIKWRDHLLLPLHVHLIRAILSLIDEERNGAVIDWTLVQIIRSSMLMKFDNESDPTPLVDFRKILEQHYLRETEAYYAVQSYEYLKRPVTEYMRKVEQCFCEEQKRIETFLGDSMLTKKLSDTCERVLIKQHLDLFYAAFPTLLLTNKVDDLSRMYSLVRLASPVHGLDQLKTILMDEVISEGKNAIQKFYESAEKNATVFVQMAVEVHEKYKAIVGKFSKNDPQFIAAFDKACKHFLNSSYEGGNVRNTCQSSQILVRYCDKLLRKSRKNPTEAVIDAGINVIVTLLKYIDDIDSFEKFYYNFLAKRLLMKTSSSKDAEILAISKLKPACGSDYASKLERMFVDVTVSEDLQAKFRTHLAKLEKSLEIDFEIQLLPSGNWPLQLPSVNVSLPFQLESCINHFSAFYNDQHEGRTLHWLYPLSRGEIITNCFEKKYILEVSTFQMALLLMFNDMDSCSVNQVLESTLLKLDYLQQELKLLLKANLLMISSSGEKKNLTEDTEIKLNSNFTNKARRINVYQPMKINRESEEKDFEDDRINLTEAAIIRIMKVKNTLDHQQLVAEVLQYLSTRFKPSVSLIKRCIEILIDKDYLKRDYDHPQVYFYKPD